MPNYHVRVIPSNGKPDLYLSRRWNDFHDGPFTSEARTRLTFGTPTGADRRIAAETDRLPNKYYGDVTFVVVEEADQAVCRHCKKPIHNEPTKDAMSCWVDEDGNDNCPFGFVPVPHEPA